MTDPKDALHRHADVLEISGLRATLGRAARLLLEAVVVPTVLLAVLLHVIGTTRSILVAVGWCLCAIGFRWLVDRRLPGTLLLGSAAIAARAAFALLSGSLLVYLLQPVLGSIVMAVLFLGSAAFGRPITLRLARDFVHVPAHILDRRGVRRMFTEVAIIWGVSRLIDVAMNLGFLHRGVDAGLWARGLLSPLLTVLAVAVCTAWGWRSLRRNGIRVKISAHAAPSAA
ncbi:MAG TPA: VC0807 family protein [Mycobacteriales bacterium]|nr:VC0807 family protein [Mycobacteriales bacterium]